MPEINELHQLNLTIYTILQLDMIEIGLYTSRLMTRVLLYKNRTPSSRILVSSLGLLYSFGDETFQKLLRCSNLYTYIYGLGLIWTWAQILQYGFEVLVHRKG